MKDRKIKLLIADINAGADGAPEWMLLFAAGWGELADGLRFLVDQAAFDMVRAAVEALGNEVVFDYEHQTLKDMPAPAAGWIKELAWEHGVGIKARVEWTGTAADYIAKGEYRYFSPVFYVRQTDQRVCGLHSAALTNTPKTKHLTPILAKLEAGLNNDGQNFRHGGTFVPNKETDMDRKQLIAALGLEADATDAQCLAAVAQLGIQVPEEKEREIISKAVLSALDLGGDANESTVVASINVLKQERQTSVSAAEFQALKDDLAARDARDAVDAAIAKGKVIPAQKEWATAYATKDPAGFALYVAKAPMVVPVGSLPGQTQQAADPVADEEVAAVAKMMGVDLEDIKKYNGREE